jgi:S-formylglutathione hydrolase FrmB
MRRKLFTVVLAVLAFILVSAMARAVPCPKCKTFYTEALGTKKQYRIFLPPGYDKDKTTRYPVVYLLHGYDFARNKPDQSAPNEGVNHWMEQENLGPVATCLMTVKTYDALRACLHKAKLVDPDEIAVAMQKEYPKNALPLPRMIVVMPEGDNSFYLNRSDGKKVYPPLDGPKYVDGMNAGVTGMYEDYIVKDLVTFVDKTYRTIPDRNHRAIGGFSMGGIGSMNLLLRHPDVFCSVTSLSPIFTLKDMLTDPLASGFMLKGTPEAVSLFAPGSQPGKKPKVDFAFLKQYDPIELLKGLDRTDVRFYFDAGSGDFFSGRNNFSTFKKFDDALKAKGFTASPAVHIIPGNPHNRNGLHTAIYWRSRLGVILKFHADSFAQFGQVYN